MQAPSHIEEPPENPGRFKSLFTSGSFLKLSIAGEFGARSHGSRFGCGGIWDMVRGMHLIASGLLDPL